MGGFELRNGTLLLSTEAPGGVYNSEQLKKIAALSDQGAAIVKVTEDQRLALFVGADQVEAVAAELREMGLGLRHYQEGLHQPTCCVGALCAEHKQDALGDTMQLTEALADLELNYALRIGLNGCGRCCVPTHTLDISLTGDEGGYRLHIGGKNTQVPELAMFIAEGIPGAELPGLLKNLLSLYKEKAEVGESLQECVERLGVGGFAEVLSPYSQDANVGVGDVFGEDVGMGGGGDIGSGEEVGLDSEVELESESGQEVGGELEFEGDSDSESEPEDEVDLGEDLVGDDEGEEVVAEDSVEEAGVDAAEDEYEEGEELGVGAEEGEELGVEAEEGEELGVGAEEGEELGVGAEEGEELGVGAEEGEELGVGAEEGEELPFVSEDEGDLEFDSGEEVVAEAESPTEAEAELEAELDEEFEEYEESMFDEDAEVELADEREAVEEDGVGAEDVEVPLATAEEFEEISDDEPKANDLGSYSIDPNGLVVFYGKDGVRLSLDLKLIAAEDREINFAGRVLHLRRDEQELKLELEAGLELRVPVS